MDNKRRNFFQRLLGQWLDPEETQPTPERESDAQSRWSKGAVTVSWEGEVLECRLVDGELWMTLASICKAAGIVNASNVASRLSPEDKRDDLHTVDAMGRRQWDAVWVNLGAFFEIVLTSRKPEAMKLKRFVAHDLLPSIQKFGCYPPPEEEAVDQAPIRPWIRKAARKCGFPPEWQKRRQRIADGNKQSRRDTIALGGDAITCSRRFNEQYTGVFGKDANGLKAELGCRYKDSPLNQMGNTPLSLFDAVNSLMEDKIKEGSVTADNLLSEARATGEAIRETALSVLGPGHDFRPTEGPKGRKILDTVRGQLAS